MGASQKFGDPNTLQSLLWGLPKKVHLILGNPSGMNSLMCAVFAGDAGMVRLLAEKRADTNHKLPGLRHV